MAVIKWDSTGERFFEMGVKKGVLYPIAPKARIRRVLPGMV